MSRILFTLLICILTFFSTAQVKNKYEGVTTLTYAKTDVIGSPFIFEDWFDGILDVNNRGFGQDRNPIKIDILDQKILIQFDERKEQALPLSTITGVILYKSDSTFLFRRMSLPGVNEDKLCQVLHDGVFQFYKEHVKIYKKAKLEDNILTNSSEDQILDRRYYYLKAPNNDMKKIKLTKKSVLKAMPDWEDRVSSYIKLNKIKQFSEQQLKQLLMLLED
jgi:hypothetical protein